MNIFNEYHRLLYNLEIRKLIKRPVIPKYTKHNAHIYYLIVKNNQRNRLIKYLKQKKINTVFHYIPLHSSPYGRLKTKVQSTMHNTNFISNNLLRLPMSTYLKKDNLDRICKNINNFFKKYKYSPQP